MTNGAAGLGRLTTPRAAAWAGVLFAVLFGLSLVLVRTTVPPDPSADPGWLAAGAGRLRVAVMLMPFSGLAFLWFIGVVRDRLGTHEDRFLSTVFLGSGLLFLAMAFVSMAIAGGILTSIAAAPGQSDQQAVVRFGRATMIEISNVYGLRMAGAFMISLGTMWLRTRIMPLWLIALTYSLALALLLVTNLSLWATLLFPGWVLVVSLLFLFGRAMR